jgi:hypothetical protein
MSSEPFWKSAQAEYEPQVAAASARLCKATPRGLSTTRVSQLDAFLLDAELENILTEPLLKSLKFFGVRSLALNQSRSEVYAGSRRDRRPTSLNCSPPSATLFFAPL